MGVIFYYLSEWAYDKNEEYAEDSFINYFDGQDDQHIMATLLYFTMTTLAKIGYGDFFPKSDAEKIYTVIILMISIVFFSYVLDQFMDLMAIKTSKESITNGHIIGERFAMQAWLKQVSRYRDSKPLPQKFYKSLMDNLQHYLEKDRNNMIMEGAEFLHKLPQSLKRSVLVGYIYDDVFSDFRKFFRPYLYADSDLLENLSYNIKHRFIQGQSQQSKDLVLSAQERSILYKEGDEVQEIFFINKGEIGVGYTYFMNNVIGQRKTHMCLILGMYDFVGDHAVLFDLKSQHYYEAKTDVVAFALDKTPLLYSIHKTNKLHILLEFKERSKLRHERLSDAIRLHKEEHIRQVNNDHNYYHLNLINFKLSKIDSSEHTIHLN